MAKYCPAKQGPALYLDCLECEDKVCEKQTIRVIIAGTRTFTKTQCKKAHGFNRGMKALFLKQKIKRKDFILFSFFVEKPLVRKNIKYVFFLHI